MTDAITAWKDLLGRARGAAGFTDRSSRECHELRDQLLTIAHTTGMREPLLAVRHLGWYYPSDEELRSVLLSPDDQHLYSFASRIAGQLPALVAHLRRHPETRRALLQLADLRPETYEEPHVPCLISAWFAIRDGKLTCTVHARSVDVLIGLPANLYQAGVLLEHVAHEVGVPPGALSMFMDSAHVFAEYDPQLDRILRKP